MIDLDELEAELNTFMSATPSKNDFFELIKRTRAAESKLAEIEAQEPVAWQYQDRDGNWQPFANEKHRINTIESGEWNVRELFAKKVQPSPAVAEPAIDKQQLKSYIDQNIHDGENRSGTNDALHFTPDELQEFVEECVAHLLSTPTPPSAEQETIDARRYARLRILGAAPHGTKQLENRSVIRFQSLDDFLDADIKAHPSRGEAYTIEQPDSVAPNEPDNNFCALNTITDDQVRKVARAFWRRIYPYRNDFEIELPSPMPVEFMSFMATALTWVDKPSPATKPQRITEQDARAFFKIFFDFTCRHEYWNYDFWFENYGEALLAKLNEHRELDYKAQRDELLEVLMRVDGFLYNGITLGYIRMPDADCPDPAKEVPWLVREAIAKASASTDSGVE